MSRKSKRNRPQPVPAAQASPPSPTSPPPRRNTRRNVFIGAVIALVLAFVVATLVYKSEKATPSGQAESSNQARLASAHAPTLGRPDAKVHIVEFFDPACETCAVFYPHVKRLMAANPDRIRLSVRHAPFHKGSELPVRILEASRKQDKYWQTLEALYANQERWVVNHRVVADGVWPSLASAGLDLDRIRGDMNAPEVDARIERDLGDIRALGVNKTPEFFVNGRPLPRFGLEELQGLVKEELRRAYP